jgi:hypothetical protein
MTASAVSRALVSLDAGINLRALPGEKLEMTTEKVRVRAVFPTMTRRVGGLLTAEAQATITA